MLLHSLMFCSSLASLLRKKRKGLLVFRSAVFWFFRFLDHPVFSLVVKRWAARPSVQTKVCRVTRVQLPIETNFCFLFFCFFSSLFSWTQKLNHTPAPSRSGGGSDVNQECFLVLSFSVAFNVLMIDWIVVTDQIWGSKWWTITSIRQVAQSLRRSTVSKSHVLWPEFKSVQEPKTFFVSFCFCFCFLPHYAPHTPTATCTLSPHHSFPYSVNPFF